MNIKDFKEWLNNFPDDTIIEVVQATWGGYGGGDILVTEFEADDHCFEYTDFVNNQFVKPEDEFLNKKYLLLGGR